MSFVEDYNQYQRWDHFHFYSDEDGATDAFTGNAFLLEMDFHFEMDTIGSRDELTK